MKKKRYVVRQWAQTGITQTRDECKQRVHGYPWARYKSFASESDAQYARLHWSAIAKPPSQSYHPDVILPSITVDASCLGNPWIMEYQGVAIPWWEKIFAHWPIAWWTNNIGEYLAIVGAMQRLQQKKKTLVIYSDSRIAMGRVKKKHCNTTIDQSCVQIHHLINEATTWLQNNSTTQYTVIKRETRIWGEIPADFWRK